MHGHAKDGRDVQQTADCNHLEEARLIERHKVHIDAHQQVPAIPRPRKVKDALSYIQMMQKLCNHPKILELSCGGKAKGLSKEELALFGVPIDTPGADEKEHNKIYPELSGKMEVLHNLMDVMWRDQDAKKAPEKIVVISVYTQTLDLVQRMCKGKRWPVVRLDGSLAVKKRMELVNNFNDPNNRNSFAFLLSSKAGGCGINLIGANRLVLFDSDWNPATDKQAAARCWRDGQQKNCYTYRFLSAGTLEEKIFQRQLSKEGLAAVVEDKEQVNSLSSGELKQLFSFRENTPSDTHDKLKCTHCKLAVDQQSETQSLAPEAVNLCDGLLDVLLTLPEARHFISSSSSSFSSEDPSRNKGGDGDVRTAANLVSSSSSCSLLSTSAPSDATCSTATCSSFAPANKNVAKSKANKKEMMTLEYVRERLHNGSYQKLPGFHKDVRNMISLAKKSTESATDKKEIGQFHETFEEQWAVLAPRITELSSMGMGVKCFTEEELAEKSAQLEAAAMASANCGPVRRTFNAHASLKSRMVGDKARLIRKGKSGAKMDLSLAEASVQKKSAEVDQVSLSQGSSNGPAFKPQHELPQEEDLNNWSHHFSTATVDDEYLKRATAGTDLVSFVFGLRVNWDLTQQQLVIDSEKEEGRKKCRAKDLEAAKSRLGAKKESKQKTAANGSPNAVKSDQMTVATKESDDGNADCEGNNDSDYKQEGGEPKEEDRANASHDKSSNSAYNRVGVMTTINESYGDYNDHQLVTTQQQQKQQKQLRMGSKQPAEPSTKLNTSSSRKLGTTEARDGTNEKWAVGVAAAIAASAAAAPKNICPYCTFENTPNRKTCGMCKQKLCFAPVTTKRTPKHEVCRKRNSPAAFDSLRDLTSAVGYSKRSKGVAKQISSHQKRKVCVKDEASAATKAGADQLEQEEEEGGDGNSNSDSECTQIAVSNNKRHGGGGDDDESDFEN